MQKIMKRLRVHKKRKDFDVKLGSVLLPEVRDYYRVKRVAYLEEKPTFQNWGSGNEVHSL